VKLKFKAQLLRKELKLWYIVSHTREEQRDEGSYLIQLTALNCKTSNLVVKKTKSYEIRSMKEWLAHQWSRRRCIPWRLRLPVVAKCCDKAMRYSLLRITEPHLEKSKAGMNLLATLPEPSRTANAARRQWNAKVQPSLITRKPKSKTNGRDWAFETCQIWASEHARALRREFEIGSSNTYSTKNLWTSLKKKLTNLWDRDVYWQVLNKLFVWPKYTLTCDVH
jgi:hypothetical protein